MSPIGQGAYGVVVAAKIKNPVEGEDQESKIPSEEGKIEGEGAEAEGDDQMVAIKKIVLQNFTAGMIRRTLREIKILRLLQHENMLTLLTIMPPPSREEFKEIYMVSNLMPTNLTAEIHKYAKQ